MIDRDVSLRVREANQFFLSLSPSFFSLQEDIGKVSEAEERARWLEGDCSTVALLISNLMSKAIKQSAGGMSCFDRSAIAREGYGVHSRIYTYFLRVHTGVLH